jgi:uncharacterized cupin superfamily protein
MVDLTVKSLQYKPDFLLCDNGNCPCCPACREYLRGRHRSESFEEAIKLKGEYLMVQVFNSKNLSYELKQSPIPEFSWHTSEKLSQMVNSKHLKFDVRLLDPGKYSYPYHFHRNAEEMFVILSGRVTLRTSDRFVELNEGDIVFFEIGPEGAHQLYNHTDQPCRYLDIRTDMGIDVCEYPDSGKINVLPYQEVYQSNTRVDYYKDEDKVSEKWIHIGI